MVDLEVITNTKLRKLIQQSEVLNSLPNDQFQQMVNRFASLDSEGQQEMIALLEKQQTEMSEDQMTTVKDTANAKQTEALKKGMPQNANIENQITAVEDMTTKIIGAERTIDRLILLQKEQPEQVNNLNQAENLLNKL